MDIKKIVGTETSYMTDIIASFKSEFLKRGSVKASPQYEYFLSEVSSSFMETSLEDEYEEKIRALRKLQRDGLVMSFEERVYSRENGDWLYAVCKIDEDKLVNDSNKSPAKKLNLAEHKIVFEPETSKLIIGDVVIDIPEYKKEYSILEHLFLHCKKGQVVDWEILHEAITGTSSESIDKEKIESEQRSIRDAIGRTNERVAAACATQDRLLKWSEKTVKRNY
ncbi:MAG: hypothetical protein JWN37_666 [Candidatus Nomurabacteria bacterium]|nr:hypothetical protein [Candidatus Nomurabacteria bacterium]